MITLFSDSLSISPYVFSSFISLREKGLPFELVFVDLEKGEQHAGTFQDASLTSRVPALHDGAIAISESSAIVEYLDEAYPAPAHAALLPRSLADRARARQLMAWMRSDLMALRDERPTTTMFLERAKAPLTKAGEEAAAKLVRVADAALPSGKTSLFDAYSIVDSELAFMLHRLLLNGHDVPAKVRAFAEAQWRRPSVAEYVARERPGANL